MASVTSIPINRRNVKKNVTEDFQICAVLPSVLESYFGLVGFQDGNDGSRDGTRCGIHLEKRSTRWGWDIAPSDIYI